MSNSAVLLAVLLLCGTACLLQAHPLGSTAGAAEQQQQQQQQRLIAFNETTRVWLTEAQIEDLIRDKVQFMDVTDHQDLLLLGGGGGVVDWPLAGTPLRTGRVPSAELARLLEEVSAEEIGRTIGELSQLETRYYTTPTGVQAAHLLHGKYLKLAGGNDHISVRFFEHSWAQPSVIARIEGTSRDNAHEVVILGGHEDSVSSTTRAPGADDDASGSASVLEVFRVLAANGFRGRRSIEFHAYAAEEVGRRGSLDIAAQYQRERRAVAGMLQLDMVGYVNNNDPVFGVITDYVSAPLTQFLRELASKHTSLRVVDTRCGYACSDHSSWTTAGYQSAFPFETAFEQHNPYIHTSQDTLAYVSLEHAREFARVSLAFVTELANQ